MLRIMTAGFAGAVSALAVSAAHADEIVIRDFFGTVELEFSGSGDIAAAKSGPGAGAVQIASGDTVTIDGGQRIDRRRWQRQYNAARRGFRGRWGGGNSDPAFRRMLEEQPVVTISAPEGTDLRVVDSAVMLKAQGAAGAVEVEDNIHLLVTLGDIESGRLGVHGSGYLKAGDVAGTVAASVHGSGDLVLGNAGSAELSVHGSGDLVAADVAGALTAAVHGSGDLEVGDVGGPVEASVHGSGDLDVGRAAGWVDARVRGSGDLAVAAASGDVEALVSGSGDLDIDGGRAAMLTASVTGSGEFGFDGVAERARLRSSGSGGIRVGKVTGDVDANGRDIRVDGRKVGDPRDD